MQISATQLNKERLTGNKLFLHNFKNFSTTSPKISLRMHIVHALLAILAILSITYIVLVISIIFTIISKKESLADINNINFNIAKIEKKYNFAVTNLTKDFALANGYVDAGNNNFVSRKDSAASLSFLYEGKSNQ